MKNASKHLKQVSVELEVTANERAWVEFIRLSSYDTDPAPTLAKVQKLQRIFTDIDRSASDDHG